MTEEPSASEPFRARMARWAVWFVVAVTLGVLLGLFAEGVLDIHYRWGLGGGIAIAAVLRDVYDDRRRTRRNDTAPDRT